MNISIVSWNVRGINCREKRRTINSAIKDWKADVICLQETKLEGNRGEEIKQVWGNRGIKYGMLEASGTRGAILMMWDSKSWEGRVVEIGSYSFTCSFKSTVNDFSWHMTGVYAPTCNRERQEVWWELGAVRGLFSGPWVLGGDFNIVRYASEKRNCLRTSGCMNNFADFIEEMELIDPPLVGGSNTWIGGDSMEAASRIDRIMYSNEWGDYFSNVKQELLPRVCSDHVSIALKSGNWNHTKSYFKFEG